MNVLNLNANKLRLSALALSIELNAAKQGLACGGFRAFYAGVQQKGFSDANDHASPHRRSTRAVL